MGHAGIVRPFRLFALRYINIRDRQWIGAVPIPTNGTICLVAADSL
jgi:hypothetical protein